MSNTPFPYEFLFRGSDPEDNATSDAWHYEVRARLPIGLSGTQDYDSTGVMPIALAESKGYTLPTVISSINTSVMVQSERLTNELAQANADLEIANSTIVDLQAQLAALTPQ